MAHPIVMLWAWYMRKKARVGDIPPIPWIRRKWKNAMLERAIKKADKEVQDALKKVGK